MIRVADLDTYLHTTLGLDSAVQVLPGALVDVAGFGEGQTVFITPTPGAGLLLEGASDVPGAQLRFRGNQGNADDAYSDAEGLAKLVDDLLVTAKYPTTIGGRRVIRLYRAGGGPA